MRQTATLAQKLIRESCRKQGIEPWQLTIHADHGSPMIAKSTAQLFITLGINKSHSRPPVSDDNPYSESQFKTLKYHPEFPDRFGSAEDAVEFCRFLWVVQHGAPTQWYWDVESWGGPLWSG